MGTLAADEKAEAEAAVRGTNRLVRAQLATLQAEHGRLSALVAEREIDLQHLLVLLGDLSYGSGPSDPASPARRWTAQLDGLRRKERELRDAIETLNAGLKRVAALITAVSTLAATQTVHAHTVGAGPLEAAIAGRTLEGQEAERSRLAREVHDGPAQVLANAIMGLEYCERLVEKRPESVSGELQRLKAGMSEGLDEVRRFIFDLRPSSLEHEGLRATLARYTANYENRFGVRVALQCEDVDQLVTPEQRFAAFRVIQEAMQNCRKHAAATEMRVVVARDGDAVSVCVEDNGRGFDLDRSRARDGHYGLQGMRERAELNHGTLVIFSEPGYGTEVRLWLPVPGGGHEPNGGSPT
jgi:two-component system sensor histidine kinase DegS